MEDPIRYVFTDLLIHNDLYNSNVPIYKVKVLLRHLVMKTVSHVGPRGIPMNFVQGGGGQQIQLRTEGRENRV
jgi:hypothetical protein